MILVCGGYVKFFTFSEQLLFQLFTSQNTDIGCVDLILQSLVCVCMCTYVLQYDSCSNVDVKIHR